MTREDFSIFKLKSAVFMINFPLSFTIHILNVWKKVMPSALQSQAFNDDELEQILQTKQSIKEFEEKLIEQVQSLLDYLVSV